MAKTLQVVGNIKVLDGTTEEFTKALSVSENVSEWTLQTLSLDASASDVSVSFGGVNADSPLVIIVPTYVSSGYITAKVNGGTDAIPIGKLFVIGGSGSNGVDAITLSNPDASNAVTVNVYIGK